MKRCLTAKCEGTEFYVDNSRLDKLTKYCRECTKQRSKRVKAARRELRVLQRRAKTPRTPQEKIITAIKAGKKTEREIAGKTRIHVERLDNYLAELTLDHVLRSRPFGEYQRIYEVA